MTSSAATGRAPEGVPSQTTVTMPRILFREINGASSRDNWSFRAMHHPFFAWAGMRPLIAQHTEAEHRALEKHARERSSLVEIGVAEGASAVALRTTMDPAGTLYLVDFIFRGCQC